MILYRKAKQFPKETGASKSIAAKVEKISMVARLAFLVPNSKILALFENSWHFIC